MNFNKQQKLALQLFETGENLVILGPAGTGKSEVVREIRRISQREGKRVRVTASTGVASGHVGGCTIHSLLKTFNGVEKYPIDYDQKTENIADTDVLIIDEISMLNARMLSYIADCLRSIKRRIQLILVGDFKQLKPVHGEFAFMSKYWEWFGFSRIFLTEVIRQEDAEMIKNLQYVSDGISEANVRWYFLNNDSERELDAIFLCNTNDQVKEKNTEWLERIKGPSRIYMADSSGEVDYDIIRPDELLEIKQNVRVMTLVNDQYKRFHNGSMGTVMDMDDDVIRIRMDNAFVVDLQRYKFMAENKADASIIEEVYQFPIRLARAMTIDKSQGQTFDKANIYSGDCWRHGQLYTALSRVRTVGGMHLIHGLWPKNFIYDERVKEFYRNAA